MLKLLLTAALAIVAVPLSGQDLQRPPDWKVRFDRADAADSSLYFVSMPPGWHITTGPSGILYDPDQVVDGQYNVTSEIYLFPGEAREAFGVFLGGQDLDAAGQRYTYFLIRKDGQFLIKRRNGSDTPTLHPWTAHSAILKHDGGEGTVKNVLEIHVRAQEVHFLVNGETVASLPRTEVDTDGVVGLRVNHNLNLHVTSLDIER
jgi:hypothetical protein